MSGFCSMFSQLLKLFPRTEFQALVKRTHAERPARGFSCWGHFVAMLCCQLGRAHSLREICGGLRSSEGKLTHLGISAPSRSTLAYANEHRPWQLYRAVFQELLARCRPLAKGRRKFRFKNKLVSLDSTVIDLCAALFDWAHFRRTKGAVKLHCLLDHDGYLPSVVVVTEGKRHDVRVARTLRLDPGTIVVMDRGYVDYAWFGRLTTAGVFFVTRLKDNAVYTVVERRRVPERSAILRDEVIELTGGVAAAHCPHRLRRVEVDHPEKGGTLVFLTNHLALGATTIAAIYKDRWQIELFFRAPKQNLKIKTFVGTSANALDEHGVFRYSGEGQVGDMEFTGGNRAIRDRAKDSRDLHLFEQLGRGLVRYVGRFSLNSRKHLESLGLHSPSLPTLDSGSSSSTNTAQARISLVVSVSAPMRPARRSCGAERQHRAEPLPPDIVPSFCIGRRSYSLAARWRLG